MAPTGKTKIALNLDVLEREDGAEEPFVVAIGGKDITFKDAADVDWQVLRDMDGPEDMFETCLSDEDREYLYKQKLPGWKFRALWEGYQKHYGLIEDKGNSRA